MLTLTNNIISKNTAIGAVSGCYPYTGVGGGIYAFVDPTVTLTNNTISDNTAAADGGGIYVRLQLESDRADIYNNIIWRNSADTRGHDLFLMNDGDSDFLRSEVNLFHNDFDQSAAGMFMQLPFVIDPSNLNNVDPLFVDAHNGDYHLQAGSPGINKGENDAPGIPDTDKDSKPRIIGRVVDLGAFEFGECPPDIKIEPLVVNFGAVRVGTSKSKVAHIRNNGCADLQINAIEGVTLPFNLEGPQPPFTVAPHKEVEVVLTFKPTQTGRVQQPIGILSNDPDEPGVEVTLKGKGRGRIR